MIQAQQSWQDSYHNIISSFPKSINKECKKLPKYKKKLFSTYLGFSSELWKSKGSITIVVLYDDDQLMSFN